MNQQTVKSRITRILKTYLKPSNQNLAALIPSAKGKLYEAYILSIIARELTLKEGCKLKLVRGKNITFKSSGGPINQSYPYIQVWKYNQHFANIWTDIECLSLSHYIVNSPSPPSATMERGEYHELDIILVPPNIKGMPRHIDIYLAVECKDTHYEKHLLREILGVRRELSFLTDLQNTCFSKWPCNTVAADPPSCILVYSTDSNVKYYSNPGKIYGIQFYYEPLP